MNDTLKAAGRIGAELGAAKAEVERLREALQWIADYAFGDNGNDAAQRARAALSQQAEPECDTCHGQGEVWTGENQSLGYMSMQPPEPIMEACPECGGKAEPVEPDCDRSACGDFSPGPCDNPGCSARRDKPSPTHDEREAFEAWLPRPWSSDTRFDEEGELVYAEDWVQGAWIGWQAARATRPAQPEQQPIGWVTEDYLTDKSATTYSHFVADRWRAKGWPVSEIYAAPIVQTAPQPEQSGLVEPTVAMVQAACAAFRMDVSPMEAMTEALRAALSAQGQSNGDS